MEKHSHKPNYGRYVEDCPRCIERYPDGPPKREAKPKDESVAELAKIMLRRETEKIKQEEEAKARAALVKEQMRASVQNEIAQKLAMQMQCPHTYPNGVSARTDGQIYNNGEYRPFCQVCSYEFPRRRAFKEEQPTVVN